MKLKIILYFVFSNIVSIIFGYAVCSNMHLLGGIERFDLVSVVGIILINAISYILFMRNNIMKLKLKICAFVIGLITSRISFIIGVLIVGVLIFSDF